MQNSHIKKVAAKIKKTTTINSQVSDNDGKKKHINAPAKTQGTNRHQNFSRFSNPNNIEDCKPIRII